MERFITRTSNQISAKVGAFFSVPKSIEHNDGFSYPIWLQYVVMSLLMGMSGNQTFFGHGYPRTAIFTVASIFGILLLLQDGNRPSKRFEAACLCFLAIFALQAFSFLFFPIITVGGFFVRLFLAYAACRIVQDFPRTYINVLFWLGVISLCLFLPEQILSAKGIEVREIFKSFKSLHLVIYKFDVSGRNSSMFWEPGAFGGYLLLAIIFLGLSKEHFQPRAFWVRFIVLLVSLLSTFSTTVYMVLPIALLVYLRLGENKTKAIGTFILFYAFALSLEAGAYYLNSLNNHFLSKSESYPVESDLYLSNVDSDFIFKKIRTQYKNALKQGPCVYHNRFDNIVADLKYIRRCPLLGWGLNDETRYMLHRGAEYGSGHGVGLTDWLCKVGLAGLGVFSLCVLRSFIGMTGGKFFASFVAAVSVLMILNGECFLTHPLFMGLMFIGERSRITVGDPTCGKQLPGIYQVYAGGHNR